MTIATDTTSSSVLIFDRNSDILHIFVVIEYELAGTKATTGICQLSFAFHLNHLNLRSYIFFFHFTTSFLPLWMYIPFVVGLP